MRGKRVGGGPREVRAAGPGVPRREVGIGDRTMPAAAPPAFSEEPIRDWEDWDRNDTHTSRCGNWPASIGVMGGGR